MRLEWVSILSLCLIVGFGACNPFLGDKGQEGDACDTSEDCSGSLTCFQDVCTADPPVTDFDADGYDSELYGGDDCDDRQAAVHPTADEVCDGIDNNCDDEVDEGHTTRACELTNGHGTCTGQENCDGEAGWRGCTADTPQAEICDGADNNCDGQADEGLTVEPCELQAGVCAGTNRTCMGVNGWSECDYGPAFREGQEAACDQLDEDCDGQTDEDAPPLLVPEIGPLAQDGIDNNCNGLVDEVGGVSIAQVRPDGTTIWIDVYEATLYQNPDCTGARYGENVDDYPVGFEAEEPVPSTNLYACSFGGQVPSGHLSWFQARSACEAQGKRLCDKDEYSRACIIGEPSLFPYGPIFVPGACNDAFQEIGQAVETGAYLNCTNGSTFDMTGNLAEWVNNWHGDHVPASAHVAGWGYSPVVCSFGVSCSDYVHGTMEDACMQSAECPPPGSPICYQNWCLDEGKQILIKEKLANCLASDDDVFGRDVFPVDEARPELGTRCCYDGP